MVRLFAVMAMALVVACGPTSTPVAARTPSSPSSQATASPGPQYRSCGPSGTRNLALITLRGSGAVVVRDITDLSQPATVSTLSSISVAGSYGQTVAHFVCGDRLSYPSDGRIFSVPISGSPITPIPGTAGGADSPAWSPDGKALVYEVLSDTGIAVHLLSGAADRVVSTTPSLGGGGCEAIQGCNLPNFVDSRLTYSPDGRYFSFVAQGFGAGFLYVWSSDGTLLRNDSSRAVTMSAWSGDGLYFRTQDGVQVWRGGTVSTFLPGIAWIRPSASPAGGQLVYTVRDAGGWGHAYIADVASGKVRELKAQRTDAQFLTSRYVWYRGERACVDTDYCGPNPPFHPSNGKTYIYDLQTGAEYESVITNLYDVWPHPS